MTSSYLLFFIKWQPVPTPVLLENKIVEEIGEKYKKTPAQVLIRFQIQRGIIVIPKSVTKKRILENFDVFNFSLNDEDMDKLFSLESGFRGFASTHLTCSKYYPF